MFFTLLLNENRWTKNINEYINKQLSIWSINSQHNIKTLRFFGEIPDTTIDIFNYRWSEYMTIIIIYTDINILIQWYDNFNLHVITYKWRNWRSRLFMWAWSGDE